MARQDSGVILSRVLKTGWPDFDRTPAAEPTPKSYGYLCYLWHLILSAMSTLFKTSIATVCLLYSATFAASAQKTTVAFATYNDSTILKMDIYQPVAQSITPRVCVIFVFGGGFKIGARDYQRYIAYFNFLSEKGYVVASMDYRLGLKDIQKPPSLFRRKPLIDAIENAVEDLYGATNYLLQQAAELHIDTRKIIVSGSSAGAITVLQGDYERRNGLGKSTVLPAGFQYAGVISFAGAIYSREGKPDYKIAPAPMLLFHGDQDQRVPYNKVNLFRVGIFGSKSIASKLRKGNHPYCFYSMVGMGHSVATYPMEDYLPEIEEFIRCYIVEERPLQVNIQVKDDARIDRPAADERARKK